MAAYNGLKIQPKVHRMHLSIGTCEIHVNVRSYVKSINVLNRFFRSLVIKTRNTPSPPEICKE